VRFSAPVVVLAMGGINGGHSETRRNWPRHRPLPATMLNGAHPFADGALHRAAADTLGAQITHAGEMWNYAAGFPHPFPHFEGHGLSTIPCKSALWLDYRGVRIGPEPLVTGFDTHALCQRVAAQPRPYTWHLLNWRIAIKELAISGAEHNASIRDRQMFSFLRETLFGNSGLVRRLQRDSPHVLADATLAGLAAKMNALTGTDDIKPEVLQASADAYDANFVGGTRLQNDDQIRRIVHARQWPSDRLRTCRPAPCSGATRVRLSRFRCSWSRERAWAACKRICRVGCSMRGVLRSLACSVWGRPQGSAAAGPQASAPWKAPSCLAAS